MAPQVELDKTYEQRVCRGCGSLALVIVEKLSEPEVVNPGTKFEFTRTERVSKCAYCYL